MLAVVVSRADAASVHVGEHLRDLTEWTEHVDGTRPDGEGGGTVYRTPDANGQGAPAAELREVDALHLDTENVGGVFGRVDGGPDYRAELLVFASRHAGETGPLLTAHHTGNLGPAEFGGEDRSLARACPNAHSRVLEALREHAPERYDVGVECTHHGPSSVGLPSMFVELGSSEEEWDDPAGARAVARAILDLRGVSSDAPAEGARGVSPDVPAERGATAGGADGEPGAGAPSDRRHLVGVGGGHYAPRFERVARETGWAVGHVAADWALEELGDPADGRGVVAQLFEQSAAARAVVDGDHPDVERVVAGLGYEIVSETWVRETGGSSETDPVGLGLVAALEDALCPVDDGLRFGDRARGAAPALDGSGVVVVDLPAELLAEAQGIDREAARATVERATLGFETAENGTRVDGRAALASPADRDALVDALADVLATDYDSVERTDEVVVAREEAFDPGRARELGVPEGPAFGQLADGQPVEVDGETVDPGDVRAERERRFSL